MILPTQLSEEALTILRLFIKSTSRKTGDHLSLEALRASVPRPAADIETALAELAGHGLVKLVRQPAAAAVLTDEAERFFNRYYWSCGGA